MTRILSEDSSTKGCPKCFNFLIHDMKDFTLRSWDQRTGQGLAQEFDDAANVQDGRVLTAGDVVPYHRSTVFDWQCRYVVAVSFVLALLFLLHYGLCSRMHRALPKAG